MSVEQLGGHIRLHTLVKYLGIDPLVEGSVTEQTDGTVVLTCQNIRWCETHMVDLVRMKFCCQVEEITQGGCDIVALGHHRRILVEQLLDGDEVTHLDSYGIDTVVALIGREVQLMFRVYLSQCLMLSLHATAEGDGISHLVVKLHKVGIFPVNKPLIEITIRHTHFRGFSDVARLKQFLVIHLFILLFYY